MGAADVFAADHERLRQALAQDFPDLAGAQRQQGAEQAADQRSLRHAITSLRLLADTDWRGLVDRSSLLIREMQACATFRAEHSNIIITIATRVSQCLIISTHYTVAQKGNRILC